MSQAEAAYHVEYPETDGQPMGETELHVHWTIRLRDILKYRFRGKQVYVGADLFIYYVEGQPQKNVAPDVFVVLDCDPRMRDVFKVWEEAKVPNVVFEITSKGTREEDRAIKPTKYARLGVEEYALYDPRGEYLRPPLQLFRLAPDGYEPVEPNERGQLECRTLGILLELDGRDLLLRDSRTAEVLPTESEAAEAERDAARAERDAALARLVSIEAELKRLREQREKGARDSE